MAIRRGGRHLQQASTLRELVRTVPIRKQAVVANPVEPIWEDVQQEATDELASGQPHDFASRRTVLSVIPPAEADMVIVEIEETAIANGNAMRVASEIRENLRRAGERTLGIDDPLGLA